MVTTKTQILSKNASLKEIDFEEITAEEEAAIKEGRAAYVKGDWQDLNQLKYELGSARNRSRSKKP